METNNNVLIKVTDLKKHFNKGEIKALDGVSLDICKGDVIVIIGPSGSGKSTFLRSLNLLEQPTEGSIVFDGVDITKKKDAQGKKIDLDEHRRKMGMVFQHFNLFPHKTIMGNMTMAPVLVKHMPQAEAEAKAQTLLQRVGLGDRADAYPAQLSGGQKQRVAIARALATNPRYLLCDEATSALDPNTTRSILELLREINQSLGVTIIVITHEMKVIDQICDRVAVIDQSRIAEEGKVSDVFTNPQSEIARELIIPQDRAALDTTGGKKLRLIFNGQYSQEPLISKLVLECQAPVNIIFADTREFDGAIYGHMIIELPSDERQADKILVWLKNSPVTWKEEE